MIINKDIQRKIEQNVGREHNEFSFEVSPFYRESQRDKHHYRWSLISSHNATNSHIL